MSPLEDGLNPAWIAGCLGLHPFPHTGTVDSLKKLTILLLIGTSGAAYDFSSLAGHYFLTNSAMALSSSVESHRCRRLGARVFLPSMADDLLEEESDSPSLMSPVLVVHGGAGGKPTDEKKELCEAAVRHAAVLGWEVLGKGGTALDAVEVAIRSLEDDPNFNAGHGSERTSSGEVELDAMLMEGMELRAGAVAAMGPVANPISVARLVMERTRHILLCGEGATRFAAEQGVPLLRSDDLAVSEDTPIDGEGHDTVGAVARDAYGCLASGSSTGGSPDKLPGRVGDSPLIGSGCYADNQIGAISCTGFGEAIMKVVLATSSLMHLSISGETPSQACANALRNMWRRAYGLGGSICIDAAGRVGIAYSTSKMPWACVLRDGSVHSGVEPCDGAAFEWHVTLNDDDLSKEIGFAVKREDFGL